MNIANALKQAWVKSRKEKAGSLQKATELLAQNQRFDACAHAAYYSVYNAVLAIAVETGMADLRFTPKRYRHREIPGFAAKCIGSTLVVKYGGKTRNYSSIEAVLELQGIRRTADYEPRCDDEEDGAKAHSLAKAILAQLV